METKNRKKVILAWSGGKDSTATGILAKLNNIHIDYIVTVMPDPFKEELILKNKFEKFMGQKVIILEGPKYEDYFYRVKIKGKYKGTIYGFPITMWKSCARILKWEPMKKFSKRFKDCVWLIGIAKGEKRNIISPNKSLLIKYNYTEKMSRELCEKHGLLNTLYKSFKRLGCVRCPKQSLKSLAIMKKIEPEKYKWCLDHDAESPVKFKEKYTFHEIDERIKELNK